MVEVDLSVTDKRTDARTHAQTPWERLILLLLLTFVVLSFVICTHTQARLPVCGVIFVYDINKIVYAQY